MEQRHWREMVEIVGVLSIVASVLLLAWEVKQSNSIARAEIEMQLADMYNQIHQARATDADFAKLFAKIDDPENQLFTATDQSQIRGLTWHYINLYFAIQAAFNNSLIDQDGLDNYKADIAHVLEEHPALAKYFIEVYTVFGPIQDQEIFDPVAKLIERQQAKPGN